MTYSFQWWCCLQLALFSLTAEAWPTQQPNPPVCIIGAGPSGLTAASKLEARGVKAVIFEKEAELGGKCQSYYDEQGIFHPMGAAFYSNASYPETLKVINTSGVASEVFALQGEREQFRFNYTAGDIESVPDLTIAFRQALGAEIPRYIQLWVTKFAKYSVPGFKNGVPDEFAVPGAEWLRQNNFTALPVVLVNPLALYGYGDINVVPALYILQYFTPDILTAFIGQHDVYYTDFHKIWVEWTKKTLSNTPIHLSHEIRGIDRSGKYPVVRYTAPNYAWGTQECSSLIMAFPPTIENLERTSLDLTQEETAVFKDVLVHNYFSSAVELALPFGVSYIAQADNITVPPPNNGQPIAILRLDERSNISTSWSWGADRECVPEGATRQLLQTTLAKINRDPRNVTAQSQEFVSEDIRAFRKWDYFPHFDTEPIRKDAYAKLNKLQGSNNTYWASGLQGMETVEWAIRAGQDVVDSYLLKNVTLPPQSSSSSTSIPVPTPDPSDLTPISELPGTITSEILIPTITSGPVSSAATSYAASSSSLSPTVTSSGTPSSTTSRPAQQTTNAASNSRIPNAVVLFLAFVMGTMFL